MNLSRWGVACLTAALIAASVAVPAAAAPGQIDPSWGRGSGTVGIDTSDADPEQVTSVADAGAGRVVAAVTTFDRVGWRWVASVASFLADGSPDPAFGTGGRVTTNFSGDAFTMDVAVQPDGRIVAAARVETGYACDDYSCWEIHGFALIRYHTDGTLDDTFGTGGTVVTALPGNGAYLKGLALLPDGKFVVAGVGDGTVLARYNGNGSLDASFGTGGVVQTPPASGGIWVESLAVQADGKPVVAGYFWDPATFNSRTSVARYTAGGDLDQTFGVAGVASFDLTSHDDSARDMALAPGGKIVLAGMGTETAGGTWGILARLMPNGQLDSTFGAGGVSRIRRRGDLDDAFDAVAAQPDGKILVGGQGAVTRFTAAGGFDGTFGTNGSVDGPPNTASIILSDDLRVLAGGWGSYWYGTIGLIHRYLNDPPTVASVDPPNRATNVSPTAVVTVRFDQAVSNPSITISTRKGTAAGTISPCAPCTTATFTPATALKTGTAYTVTISGSNANGTAAAQTQFKTARR